MRIPTGKAWVNQIFQSQIAKRGGIARRKISSIVRFASLDMVEKACRDKGYHIIEHNDQWLIFCDAGQIKMVC